jgi:hypothetical protein
MGVKYKKNVFIIDFSRKLALKNYKVGVNTTLRNKKVLKSNGF